MGAQSSKKEGFLFLVLPSLAHHHSSLVATVIYLGDWNYLNNDEHEWLYEFQYGSGWVYDDDGWSRP